MQLSTLMNKPITRVVQLAGDGETMDVTVRPLGLTDETEELLRTCTDRALADDSAEPIKDAQVHAILDIVEEWTLESEPGVPIRLVYEDLMALPFKAITHLWGRLQEAMNGSPLDRSSKRSASTSSTARKPRKR